MRVLSQRREDFVAYPLDDKTDEDSLLTIKGMSAWILLSFLLTDRKGDLWLKPTYDVLSFFQNGQDM